MCEWLQCVFEVNSLTVSITSRRHLCEHVIWICSASNLVGILKCQYTVFRKLWKIFNWSWVMTWWNVPDGTKSLPKTMLIFHWWDQVTLTLGHFHKRYISHKSPNLPQNYLHWDRIFAWDLTLIHWPTDIWIKFHISKGQPGNVRSHKVSKAQDRCLKVLKSIWNLAGVLATHRRRYIYYVIPEWLRSC